jgi:hypothetical protein
MPEMSNYCKVYPAQMLRQYQAWSEVVSPVVVKPKEATSPDSPSTHSNEFYYLHDDYIVTASIFRDQMITFNKVTDEWKKFCHDVLHFRAQNS